MFIFEINIFLFGFNDSKLNFASELNATGHFWWYANC